MAGAAATKVRAALEQPLIAAGFDIEDVVVRQAGRRQFVQVVVDKDGGVSLDDVADASRLASAALDADDGVLAGPYVLEVTSPGVDRPLTAPRHWRRNVGRLVEVRPREGAVFLGRISEATEDDVTVDVDGNARTIAYADVTRAQVQIEWNRRSGEEDV